MLEFLRTNLTMDKALAFFSEKFYAVQEKFAVPSSGHNTAREVVLQGLVLTAAFLILTMSVCVSDLNKPLIRPYTIATPLIVAAVGFFLLMMGAVVKEIASAVLLVSVLLLHGPGLLRKMKSGKSEEHSTEDAQMYAAPDSTPSPRPSNSTPTPSTPTPSTPTASPARSHPIPSEMSTIDNISPTSIMLPFYSHFLHPFHFYGYPTAAKQDTSKERKLKIEVEPRES